MHKRILVTLATYLLLTVIIFSISVLWNFASKIWLTNDNVTASEESTTTQDPLTMEIQTTIAETTAETIAETEPIMLEALSLEAELETEPTTDCQEINPDLIEYEGREYIVPFISLNREPNVTQSGYVEKFTEVPHYFQTYYPKTRYGDSTVRKAGCGITCLSMVLTYLLDEEITPDFLAEKYFRYKVEGGSSWTLFTDSAEDYGITIEKQTWKWDDVITALENGQVVIANANSDSVFTDGGHFIVLAGLTEDGKIIVRDPNLYNYSIWTNPVLEDGFANGFDEKSVKYNCFPCWIYQAKDLEDAAARFESA